MHAHTQSDKYTHMYAHYSLSHTQRKRTNLLDQLHELRLLGRVLLPKLSDPRFGGGQLCGLLLQLRPPPPQEACQ
jgi:hypothetical protein